MTRLHVAGLLLIVGCGGGDSTSIGVPDGSTDSNAGDSSGDATGSDAAGGDAAADVSTGDTGFPCPDEHGAYSVVLSGQGCGDTSQSAPECIQQTACMITFVSNPSQGMPALNGDPALAGDGSFTGGAIKEGTGPRTGCVGAWDGSTNTLTVDCGGNGSSQSCRATLTRTSLNCK